MFVFVSGSLSLDLLGTLKWRRDEPEEQLVSAAAVAAWFAASGLAVEVDTSDTPHADVTYVRTVREALYRTVTAARVGRRPLGRDVALLNGLSAAPGPRISLSPSGTVRRDATVEQALAAVVRDALNLMAGDDMHRLRECANPPCTRLYLDRSRAGVRRWCGMTECGNAAKVSAFRARQRAKDDSKARQSR